MSMCTMTCKTLLRYFRYRCVKRMDHHCPWVNNCVGHNNHKYFILFVTYATIGMGYAIITIIASIVYDLRASKKVIFISGSASQNIKKTNRLFFIFDNDIVFTCVNRFI